MTSLVVWLGVDSRSQASIYIAGDSRISWGRGRKWDEAQKVFASSNYPDIFAFCGLVDFPTLILAKLIKLIDSGALYDTQDTAQIKTAKVEKFIKESHAQYPYKNEFWIVHCLRENSGMSSNFLAYLLHWNSLAWSAEWLKMPLKSDLVIALGSGRISFERWRKRWQNIKSVKGTSRSIFGAFCDGLNSHQDNNTGGSPQLAGIYKIGEAKVIGIIYENERFIQGSRVSSLPLLLNLEWRNTLFERCDPINLVRIENAQVHRHPKGLAKSLKEE